MELEAVCDGSAWVWDRVLNASCQTPELWAECLWGLCEGDHEVVPTLILVQDVVYLVADFVPVVFVVDMHFI